MAATPPLPIQPPLTEPEASPTPQFTKTVFTAPRTRSRQLTQSHRGLRRRNASLQKPTATVSGRDGQSRRPGTRQRPPPSRRIRRPSRGRRGRPANGSKAALSSQSKGAAVAASVSGSSSASSASSSSSSSNTTTCEASKHDLCEASAVLRAVPRSRVGGRSARLTGPRLLLPCPRGRRGLDTGESCAPPPRVSGVGAYEHPVPVIAASLRGGRDNASRQATVGALGPRPSTPTHP